MLERVLRLETVPSSKSHDHAVGEPPDVSRNSTTNGVVPEIVLGVITRLALKAATGPTPPPVGGWPPPEATALRPALTGKLDSAETCTVLPRMLEMTGVMTSNVQLSWTLAESPRLVVVAVARRRRVKSGIRDDGLAARSRERTVRRRGVPEDLVLVRAWTSASGDGPQASGLFAA